MDSLSSLQDDITGIFSKNPLATAAGAGVVGLGSGVALGAAIRSRTKKKTRKSRRNSGRARDIKFKSKQKHERKYKRKRKYKIYKRKGFIHSRRSKSRKGIHYTKKGQPYKIMSNGRARFIKKKRRSR